MNKNNSIQRSKPDRRATYRQPLLLRVGKISCDGNEYVCILKDISRAGLRFTLFHDMPASSDYKLAFPSDTEFAPFSITWDKGNEFGGKFLKPLDVDDFLLGQKNSTLLQLRFAERLEGLLQVSDQKSRIDITTLGQYGATIMCDQWMAIGQRLTISSDSMDIQSGSISKRDGNQYGIEFSDIIPLPKLAMIPWQSKRRPAAGEQD